VELTPERTDTTDDKALKEQPAVNDAEKVSPPPHLGEKETSPAEIKPPSGDVPPPSSTEPSCAAVDEVRDPSRPWHADEPPAMSSDGDSAKENKEGGASMSSESQQRNNKKKGLLK